MPNWCENRLDVYGSRQDLLRFDNAFKGRSVKWGVEEYEIWNKTDEEVKKLKEEYECNWQKENVYTFNSFVPVPQAVLDIGFSDATPNRSFIDRMNALHSKRQWVDGYSWCVTHWGTKWDIGEINVVDHGPCFEYVFDTAWSPPEEWFRSVVFQYPTLEFRLSYYEEGMCFAGYLHFKDRKEVSVYNVDRSENEAEFFDFVLEEFGYDLPAQEKEWEEEQLCENARSDEEDEE